MTATMRRECDLLTRRKDSGDVRRRRVVPVLLALALVLAACRPDATSPRGAAEVFLDAYFGLDLPRAAEASAGHARALVEEERRLTAGQPVDASTRVPLIRYHLVREEPSGDAIVRLVYAIRILAPDSDPSDQRWRIMVARAEGGLWRVADFERVSE